MFCDSTGNFFKFWLMKFIFSWTFINRRNLKNKQKGVSYFMEIQ